jgi:hypothetical protein
MEYPRLSEQDDADSGSFALADFRSESDKKRLDIRPSDGPADRPGENQFEGDPVSSLHIRKYHPVVPSSTERNLHVCKFL